MENFAQINSLKYKQILDLSGGQLQRICIAATILSAPDLAILDEPTQNLDYDSEKQFYQLIKYIKNNYSITFFIISHDLHMVAKSSDKVICLNNHICCPVTLKDLSIEVNLPFISMSIIIYIK